MDPPPTPVAKNAETFLNWAEASQPTAHRVVQRLSRAWRFKTSTPSSPTRKWELLGQGITAQPLGALDRFLVDMAGPVVAPLNQIHRHANRGDKRGEFRPMLWLTRWFGVTGSDSERDLAREKSDIEEIVQDNPPGAGECCCPTTPAAGPWNSRQGGLRPGPVRSP